MASESLSLLVKAAVTGIGVDLVKKAGVALVMKAGTALLATPPGHIAGRTTAERFPKLEGIEQHLRAWLDSDAGQELVATILSGSTPPTDETIVASFISATEFYLPPDPRDVAAQILHTFFHELRVEYLKTGQGLPIIAGMLENQERRAETRSDDIVVRLQRLETLLLASDVPQVDDAARDLARAATWIASGRIAAAQTLLREIEASLTGTPAEAIYQFPLRLNYGVCAYHLDQFTEAHGHFEAALRLRPDDPRALMNLAQVMSCLGRHDDALEIIEKGVAVAPDDSDVRSAHLSVTLHIKGLAVAHDRLTSDPDHYDTPTCRLILAEDSIASGKLELATELLSTVDPAVGGYHLDRLRAHLSVRQADASSADQSITADFRASLCDADTRLTHHLSTIAPSDLPLQRRALLLSRAAVRESLGRIDEALDDCAEVRRLAPTRIDGFRAAATILGRNGRTRDVINLLQSDNCPSLDLPCRLMLGWSLCEDGRFEDAQAIARELDAPAACSGPSRWTIAALQLAVASALKLSAEIESLHSFLRDEAGASEDARLVLAQHLADSDKLIDAAEILERAETPSERESHLLIDIYGRLGRFDDVVSKLSGRVRLDEDSLLFRWYVAALVNSQRYGEALDATQPQGTPGAATGFVAKVRAQVLDWFDDLDAALELRRASRAVLGPDNSLHIAKVLVRLGRLDEARAELAHYDQNDSAGSPRDLMSVAYLRMFLGMPGALDAAFRARARALEDSDIHTAYVRLFLATDQNGQDPNTVVIGTSAEITNGSDTRHFSIVDDGSIDVARGWIPSTHATASRLLGKGVGDVVELSPSAAPGEQWTVKRVISKFARAFVESVDQYPYLFPNSADLVKVSLGSDPAQKIREHLDSQEEEWNRLAEVFRAGFPLAVVAAGQRCSRVRLWARITETSNGILPVSDGTEESTLREYAIAKGVSGLVLDLSAILTCYALRVHHQLPRLGCQLLVPRAVIEELNEHIVLEFGMGPPSLAVGKRNGQYVRSEVTAEDFRRARRDAEALRDWLTSNAEIVPSYSLRRLPPERTAQCVQLLGKPAVVAALVAAAKGVPLVADDFGFLQLAKNEWSVPGISSHALFYEMSRRGIISTAVYHGIVSKMVCWNYRYLPVSVGLVMFEIRRAGMTLNEAGEALVVAFCRPEMNEAVASQVLSGVCEAVAASESSADRKRRLVRAICEAAERTRSGAVARIAESLPPESDAARLIAQVTDA